MNLGFDHILIETTGIAEPDVIVQNIIANEELKQYFFIDSICCLIDTINFKLNLNERENIKQLTTADIVLINKTETADNETIDRIIKKVKEYNPICETINTKYGDYGNSKIMDKHIFNETDFNGTFNKLQINSEHHGHHHEIKTLSFLLKSKFDKKISMWMDYFSHINQNSIIRVKGILSFEGISRKMIFQAVKSAYMLEEGNFWQTNEERSNKIIFIGRKLDKESIREGVEFLVY